MIFKYKTYDVPYEYIHTSKPQTILFLHGWGGNLDSFASCKKFFAHQFNILSISFPPYQNSASIISLDMCDYRNITLGILNLLNLTNAIIICHSFGFRVALMLTTTNIKIDKIVVAGGAGIRLKPNLFKKLGSQHRSILLNKYPQLFTKFASNDYMNLNAVDRQTFKNIVNKDLTNYIPQLKCPALLFWGGKDSATPIKFTKIIKRLNPRTQLEIIRNGDHFCYLKHNQLFIDCCNKFLKEGIV